MRAPSGGSITVFNQMLASATPGQCLIWPFGKAGNGYGQIHVGAIKAYTHRVAWILTHGPIPTDKHVLHHCDTPACFNPSCLFLGDAALNHADQKSKGRTLIGITNPIAKLTDDLVREMRLLRGLGISFYELGKMFGVSHSTARKAVKGVTWQHVSTHIAAAQV